LNLSVSFLEPLTTEVWQYTGLAYLTISFLVFVLSRINPKDWEPTRPMVKDPQEVETIWNVMNTIWLAMASIMGQGCDILPKFVVQF
jgi:glutamate receptor, ionotropic, invertebrate